MEEWSFGRLAISARKDCLSENKIHILDTIKQASWLPGLSSGTSGVGCVSACAMAMLHHWPTLPAHLQLIYFHVFHMRKRNFTPKNQNSLLPASAGFTGPHNH